MDDTKIFIIIVGMMIVGIMPMVILLVVNIKDSIETNKRLSQIHREIREIIDNM